MNRYDRSITPSDLRFLAATVNRMVDARLAAGHHPQDVLLTALDFFDHSAAVWVDGTYADVAPTDESIADETIQEPLA